MVANRRRWNWADLCVLACVIASACSDPKSAISAGQSDGVDGLVFDAKFADAAKSPADSAPDGENADDGEVLAEDADTETGAEADGDGAETAENSCEFAADPAPGEPGSTCTASTDCQSGLCIDGVTGKICTSACVDCCPGGYSCEKLPGSDGSFACLPKFVALCRPCLSDSECSSLNPGSLCVNYGDGGHFCGGTCSSSSECPSGYTCKESGGSGKQCVRSSGECGCSSSAILAGASTTCKNVSDAGSCSGVRKCTLSGLTACDAAIPGAEICNGKDDDCDGMTDPVGSGGCVSYFTDSDGDGYGVGSGSCACSVVGLASATTGGDCDDSAKGIHPGLAEICNDIDDNCDGNTDEGCDDDGDGWCDGAMSVVGNPLVCANGKNDCLDTSASVHPGGGQEICGNGLDDNCDGLIDSGSNVSDCVIFYKDADADGFGAGEGTCACGAAGFFTALKDGDCDDSNPLANPGKSEFCGNGKDDDCNGSTDEAGASGCSNWFSDGDGDGYGSGIGVCLCGADSGHPVSKSGDCEDEVSSINPGVSESCNGIDDNCNGVTDEQDAKGCTVRYADSDGDSFGDGSKFACVCQSSVFTASIAGDCNDGVASISPAATESCNGIDDDCDGSTDGVNSGGCKLFFGDSDGDGFGDDSVSACLCKAGGVFTVSSGGDCNDGSYGIKPGAAEVCDGADNNCDGKTDEIGAGGCTVYLSDADSDGYGVSGDSACLCQKGAVYNAAIGGDCDDGAKGVHPDAKETCNGVDDDCDGKTDPASSDGCDTYFVDGDSDGYGSTKYAPKCLCSALAGYVTAGGDCNDGDGDVHPGASEVCNGKDDNCDGDKDPKDSGNCVTYYLDADSDGFGQSALSECLCMPDVYYKASVGGDCNDQASSVRPGVQEVCNGVDDNCDGNTDEGVLGTFYADVDKDNYGSNSATIQACSAPSGYLNSSGDCDDGKSSVHPGASEVCDNLDNNCDGQTDEGLGNVWYLDSDNDGYGDAGVSGIFCANPGGYVGNSADCNDNNDAVSPLATETCNGVDDNCNALTDEGATTLYFKDADGDTYGDPHVTANACALPTGYVPNNSDCNDAQTAIHPGAAETCNSLDDNCNGQTDEGIGSTYYYDGDGDNYGDPAVSAVNCSAPYKYVTNNSDCDDAKATVHPGAGETCNGIDDNCVNGIDEGVKTTYYYDGDGDGYGLTNSTNAACAKPANYATVGGDCDDAHGTAHPGGTDSSCNGIDENCDGTDNCPSATCTPQMLYNFNSNTAPGWTLGPSWEVDGAFVGTGYTLSYTYSSKPGYPATAGSTSSVQLAVPNGAKFLQYRPWFGNVRDDNALVDWQAYMMVNLNGTTSQTGPFNSDKSGYILPNQKIAINSAWWNTTVTLSVTLTTPASSTALAGGFYIDDIQIVCN